VFVFHYLSGVAREILEGLVFEVLNFSSLQERLTPGSSTLPWTAIIRAGLPARGNPSIQGVRKGDHPDPEF